jgi:hypothetical protein
MMMIIIIICGQKELFKLNFTSRNRFFPVASYSQSRKQCLIVAHTCDVFSVSHHDDDDYGRQIASHDMGYEVETLSKWVEVCRNIWGIRG